MKRQEEATRQALMAGADANLSSPTGSRPLHAAALRGSASIITTLVEHRAKVDQVDSEGYTPLMVAALSGRVDAVRALLASGADPRLTRLDTGETALHMAMNGGSPGVVRALLEAGADVNAQTTEEKFTPLDFAHQFDAKDLAKILEDNPHCNPDRRQPAAAKLTQERGHETGMAPDTADGGFAKVPVTFPEKPVPPSESVYKALSKPRGRVLLLNYEEFYIEEDDRNGAAKDRQMLKYLFEEMGYLVTVWVNLDKEDTKLALKSFRNSKELGKVDCAVVCVLSHGTNTDTFITYYGEEMTVGEVYDFFTDEQCPSLRGKPKLFLFNFCRGKCIETGCALDQEKSVDQDAIEIEQKRTVVPNKKDVLKDRISLFASVEGVRALRDTNGTLFVQAIVRAFASLAHSLDVEELAKKVNEHIIPRLQGTTTETHSVLRKRFFLNPTQLLSQ
uniref:Cysteinyl aspartate specific proteinase 3 n=1 Tax=Eriocheir sinensis TaxID=95602 RepID=A0A3G1RFS0_ERISI|nr:cysteinyl aspartate specific proteinase 3 [Eriocheir sinensis]